MIDGVAPKPLTGAFLSWLEREDGSFVLYITHTHSMKELHKHSKGQIIVLTEYRQHAKPSYTNTLLLWFHLVLMSAASFGKCGKQSL